MAKPRKVPTTRAERKAHRMARLVLAVQSAAEAWAEAMYAAGLEDGRSGIGTAPIEQRRSLAERKFRDVAARLSAAVTPFDAAQGSLPIQRARR
jgi:hypothetical protein